MTGHDVVVLGAGSGGEAVARGLADRGRSVAVVEAWLVGGECPFTACMPSKAVLHVADAGGDWAAAVAHRDAVVEHRDDSGHVADLRERGVTVVRGRGRVTGPGVLAVEDDDAGVRELGWTDLVVATGAGPTSPPLPGLDTVAHWTFEDLWTTEVQPASVVVVGGGATGLEAATALAGLGTAVTLLVRGRRLVRDAPELEQVVVDGLRRRGVDLRTGTEVAGLAPGSHGVVVTTDAGDTVTAERLLLATGKQRRTHGIGLDVLGLDPDELVVGTDGRVHGAEHVWAVGDVSGFPAFTHAANHLAEVVAANIATGGQARAAFGHTPRGVFTDPPHVLVGQLRPEVPHVRVTASYGDGARPLTDRTGSGELVLTAARGDRRVLGVGGAGALVDELASAWTIMVAAGLTVDLVAGVQQQFPTHGELTKLLAERAVAALDG